MQIRLQKKQVRVITKNTVMLGALAASGVCRLNPRCLLETILEDIPEKYKDVNKKAFEGGMKAIQKA